VAPVQLQRMQPYSATATAARRLLKRVTSYSPHALSDDAVLLARLFSVVSRLTRVGPRALKRTGQPAEGSRL